MEGVAGFAELTMSLLVLAFVICPSWSVVVTKPMPSAPQRAAYDGARPGPGPGRSSQCLGRAARRLSASVMSLAQIVLKLDSHTCELSKP